MYRGVVRRVAVLGGTRIPFCRAHTAYASVGNSEMLTAALQGLGVGLIWVPLSVITFSTLAPRDVPDGTAVFHLLRNIGSVDEEQLQLLDVPLSALLDSIDTAVSMFPEQRAHALSLLSAARKSAADSLDQSLGKLCQ